MELLYELLIGLALGAVWSLSLYNHNKDDMNILGASQPIDVEGRSWGISFIQGMGNALALMLVLWAARDIFAGEMRMSYMWIVWLVLAIVVFGAAQSLADMMKDPNENFEVKWMRGVFGPLAGLGVVLLLGWSIKG